MPNQNEMSDFFSRSGLNPQDPVWREMFQKVKRVPDPAVVRKLLALLISSEPDSNASDSSAEERANQLLEFYMETNRESFQKLAE